MINRRKFLGVAAVTSAAAFVPTRSFARTLERPATDDISWEPASAKLTYCYVIFRLYENGVEVHKQTMQMNLERRKEKTHFGVNQDFIMQGFTGSADHLTLELPGTGHEANVEFLGLINDVEAGNTLTLQGSDMGLLTLGAV